jgi:acyl-CoA thioesterase-1
MANTPVDSILVVGDSLCKGVIFDQIKQRYYFAKDCFVGVMKNLLRPKVHSSVRFGATIHYGEAQLLPRMKESEADIVLIEFGGNDCDFKWDDIAKDPLQDHQPNTSLADFMDTLQEMVREVKAQGKTPVLMNLPPLDAPAYFKWFTGGDEAKGFQVLRWLGDVSRIYWWHERYSCAIGRVARETDTRLIDIRQAFLEREDFRGYMCLDGIHPNRDGHALIADVIKRFIRRENRQDILLTGAEPCMA